MNRILIILVLIGYISCQSDLPAPQKNGSELLQPPHHVPLTRLARVPPLPNGSEPVIPGGTHHGQLPAPIPLTRRQLHIPTIGPIGGPGPVQPITSRSVPGHQPITVEPPTTGASS